MKRKAMLVSCLIVLLLLVSGVPAAAQESDSGQSVESGPSPAEEAQTASQMKWLFTYEGKPSSDLAADPRFEPLLKKFFPKTAVKFWSNASQTKYVPGVAAQYLAGNPGLVRARDDRYVTAEGSVPDFHADQGLLWVDTHVDSTTAQPTLVFAALDARGDTIRLWIFSNHDFYDNPFSFPQDLRLSVARWLAPPKLKAEKMKGEEKQKEQKTIDETILVDSTGEQQMDVEPALLGVPLSMVNLNQR